MHFPPLRRASWRLPLVTALACAMLPLLSHAQETAGETLVEIRAIAGLRYDVPRFQVAPGAKVRLVLENADDMAHNLLILAPGARTEVVTAAMTMPVTPTQDFVPKTDKVLWTIPVLTPGKKAEVSFVAPAKEGVYPYVCSYPGHGFVMFGAMYVSKKSTLPPIDKDPNVPDSAKVNATASLHAFEQKPPYLYRMFMRDSGPASIAVALPNQQNYVWDAAACRLRYAWSGAFIDPQAHWAGNGDAFAEVKGRVYWRAPLQSAVASPSGGASTDPVLTKLGLSNETPNIAFPLRFGAAANVPKQVKFHGYRLVDRYPEFRYEVDGVEVRELIKPQHHGGLEQTFTIAGAKQPVFYAVDPDGGAKFASTAGTFQPSGVLELSPEQAKSFTVTISEITGREPLAYWSMNDILADKKPLPVPGVVGRAIQFDGKKNKFATGIKTDVLKGGATFAFWAKVTKADAKEQVFIGAQAGPETFALGANVGGAGLGFVSRGGATTSQWHHEQPVDTAWHHLAFVNSADGATLYVDGQKLGSTPAVVFPAGAELMLATADGQKVAAITLDELRVYDRVLSADEVQTIFSRERTSLPTQP